MTETLVELIVSAAAELTDDPGLEGDGSLRGHIGIVSKEREEIWSEHNQRHGKR